ncbi:hypothetical protein PybrP1_009392 [[Pythium] brassicae (nom. inval.)]|nr:hypothetical protein PybrP1_009392 [[Pythium] brassicae (nom. inval.)]
MASPRRVVALVRRFEAAAGASATASSNTACCADVVEGTVRDLIARYNGMARSVPDFPRPAYSRSLRAKRAPCVLTLEEFGEPKSAHQALLCGLALVEREERVALETVARALLETSQAGNSDEAERARDASATLELADDINSREMDVEDRELEYQAQTQLHVQPAAADPLATVPEPIAVRVAGSAHERRGTKSSAASSKPAPRTLLPSRIPVRRGSTQPAAQQPSVRTERAAQSNDTQDVSSVRSNDLAQDKPSRTPLAAPVARRSSITAASTSFHGASVSAVTTLVAPPPASQPRAPSFAPINTRARSRSRDASTRPPTPPVSSTLVLPSAEIRLDGIKSRLFDYENDPKRLEMVAANRARRQNLKARVSPAV